MFVFRKEDSSDLLFEAVFLIEKSENTISDVNVVFPETDNYSVQFKSIIKNCAFPLMDNQAITWDTDMTVHFIKDEKNTQYYVYTQYYNLHSKYLSISIITKYHHFRLFSALFSTMTSQVEKQFYKKASNIKFKQEGFDIKPKKDEMNLSMGVSATSEINYLQSFFLSNYPPHLIGTLISLICVGVRIFVISSSTSKVTQTVFSIATFFYPIIASEIFHPLLTHNEIANAFKFHEGVIGINTISFLSIVDQLGQNDAVFNCDDVYIACQHPPRYKSWLNSEIASFASNIRNATMHYSPAFPSSNVRSMVAEFFLTYITKLLGSSKNPDALQAEFKKYSTNGDKLENCVCRSPVIKEFMRLTKSRDEQVMSVFWEQKQPTNLFQRNLYHKDEEPQTSRVIPPVREIGRRGKSFISNLRRK